MIVRVKVNGKRMWRVVGHKSLRNLGTYTSRKQAEERLRQIRRFSREKINARKRSRK
jgi:hypothetical protein